MFDALAAFDEVERLGKGGAGRIEVGKIKGMDSDVVLGVDLV